MSHVIANEMLFASIYSIVQSRPYPTFPLYDVSSSTDSPTSAVATPVPIREAPFSSSPTTTAPVSSSPITTAPVSSSPTSAAPISSTPTSQPPTNSPSPLSSLDSAEVRLSALYIVDLIVYLLQTLTLTCHFLSLQHQFAHLPKRSTYHRQDAISYK